MQMQKVTSYLPLFYSGTVVRGLGRGGKQLGCPTANLEDAVVAQLPPDFPCGVYYGLAQVNTGPTYRMVMSIGQNIHFGEEKKTMEAHLLHTFSEDFYNSQLNLLILGYIRPMKSFNSIGELISAIQNDISFANDKLNLAENDVSRFSNFFPQSS